MMVDNLNYDIEIIHGNNTIINEATLHFVKPYNLFVTIDIFHDDRDFKWSTATAKAQEEKKTMMKAFWSLASQRGD